MTDPDIQRLASDAARLFENDFQQKPSFAAIAPGRVEVLGNHTDYNGGFILSAALDNRTAVVAAPNGSDKITAAVLGQGKRVSVPIAQIEHQTDEDWSNYLFGVIDQIQKLPDAPKLTGMTLGVLGEVPIGAGLSSSAALEVATALAVQQLAPYQIDKMRLAQLCQRAENQFVGVQSGLMDQFSSVFGEPDSFLFLDCRTLENRALRSKQPFELVICDSMVKHALTGGEYNSRRQECESAAAKLGAKQLRDLTPADIEAGRGKLTENEYKRALHVTTENVRVLEAANAVEAGDLAKLGVLMNRSHESSRTLFENTTEELDKLSVFARTLPDCYGARMTGGGFGGAVICLVKEGAQEGFANAISERYGEMIGRKPNVIISKVGQGAMVVPV